MIHSSVAFAVPEYSLKKRLTKAVTFHIYLDSNKNLHPCKELAEKYLKKNILSKNVKSACFQADALPIIYSLIITLKLQMPHGNIPVMTLHRRWSL